MKNTNILSCLFYSALTGGLTGATVFVFKLLATKAEEISRRLYSISRESLLCIGIVFATLIALALIMRLIHRLVPEAKGGGIPRSEGILREIISFRPVRTLFATFTGSIISFFAGVGVGSEGPSVLIGTSISKILPHNDKNILTGGASAGFAAATGAPLSAIVFALEEVHKRFDALLVMSVCVAVMTSSVVNEALCLTFGTSPFLFEIAPLPSPTLSHIGYIAILGIATALFVALFDFSVSFLSHLKKKKGASVLKLIVVFVLTGFLALYFTDSVYSGHHVIEHILDKSHSVWLLIGILAVRMIMLILVCDSGVTGGIFIPSLAIGALVSAITAQMLIGIGLPDYLFDTVTLLGTCAFMGGMMRSPVMAAVLFIELTGQFTSLTYVVTVIFTTSLITELFGKKSFYDRVMEHMK